MSNTPVSDRPANPDSFAGRLKLALGDESVNGFAAKCGLSESVLRKYLHGSEPGLEKVVRIARAAGVPVDWLATGEGSPEKTSAPTTPGSAAARDLAAKLGSGFVKVPRYDIQASAGPGSLADEELIVDYMAFQETWVRRIGADPRHLALITAVGDSMEPTIRAGDLLLVDTGVTRFRDDAIYVVSINGSLMVKRIQRFFGGAVSIKSDNEQAYVDQTLNREEAEEIHVAGRVRWIGRMI